MTLGLNTGTAPGSSPADMFQMYSADWNGAGTATPTFLNEEGHVIKLYQSAHVADPSNTSNTLTDNSGGTDPADQTIAAVTTPTDLAVTYTTNDPSITPNSAITIADGSVPTNNELLEFCEELKAMAHAANDALDEVKNAVALLAAEHNLQHTAIGNADTAINSILSTLEGRGLHATS